MKKGRLKQAITRVGKTMSQIADEFGVNTNTVWRWSAGENDPKDDIKISLAKRLNTSVAYLMGETDDPSLIKGQGIPEVIERVVQQIPQKGKALEISPIAAILDSVKARAEFTSHEDRVLIAQIFRRAIQELETAEDRQLDEQMSDGVVG